MLSPQCAGGEAAIVIGFAVEEEAADSAVAKTTAKRLTRDQKAIDNPISSLTKNQQRTVNARRSVL